jgi:hypothetical protein
MEEAMKRVIMAVAVFLIIAAGTAFAATPVGQWNFTSYNDPNLKAGPLQGLCFVADGTFYSTTFSGWNGQWIQIGDRIRFYGTTGVLSTAEFGQFISNTRFSGEFAHFSPTTPVATSSSGNFIVTRTSLTCDAPASPVYSAAIGDPAIK